MGGCHNAIGFEIRDLIYCRAITVSGLAFTFCYVVTCSVLAAGRKTGFAWERVQLSESCISFDEFHIGSGASSRRGSYPGQSTWFWSFSW